MLKKSRLRVGTVSSELAGESMFLSGERRVDVIVSALRDHQPDVLLTAGHSLENGDDLTELGKILGESDWGGLLFVEVKRYDGGLKEVQAIRSSSSHCLFAWTKEAKGGSWQCMGRQYFATSQQVKNEAQKGSDGLVDQFFANLPNRLVEFRGKKFGGLICGEINALQGRDNVLAISSKIGDWFRSLDVIVNPTHDRMGNYGTVKAKRIWLSELGRAYISSSNWNTEKGQNRTPTLHSVFVDGEQIAQVPFSNKTYEYREAWI